MASYCKLLTINVRISPDIEDHVIKYTPDSMILKSEISPKTFEILKKSEILHRIFWSCEPLAQKFLKFLSHYKNAGHFISYRHCRDTYCNRDIFITIDRLVTILLSPSTNCKGKSVCNTATVETAAVLTATRTLLNKEHLKVSQMK